jgi:hypothetical protein
MLRRRLAECEGLLRTGAAVRVGGTNGAQARWLSGMLGSSAKATAVPPDFIVRANVDPCSDSWGWYVAGADGVETDEGKQARVSVWQAGSTAPPA